MEHTHAYSSWVVVDEPTCTKEGLRERTCSCGEKETEQIAVLGHTAGEAVKENEKAPTCTEAGSYDEVVYCTVCEAEVSRKTITVDALEHDYKGVVTDEPLCIMDGEKTYTCTRCGDSYMETIDALGHGWGETKPGQAPTCTSAGYTSYKTCLRCGYTTRETIPALQHDWSEQPEWNWADDYTSATATFTCARGCKETETATITSTTTATCTANGDTTYTATATFNGQTYTNEKEVKTEAAGHTWGEWTVTTPAECEKEGEKMRTCSVCGDTEKETIAALDHEWGDWEVTTEATCTTAGEEERSCSRCQETEKQTIAALDHAWSAYSFDETNHWRECTREGCTTKEQAAHSFTRNTCEICNYAFYSEGLDYKDNGDTVTITGPGSCNDTLIYIPAVMEGKPVTEIGENAFQACTSLEEIVIPDTVTSIGRTAFSYCDSLEEIVIPDSVTSIGNNAFAYCTSLTEIAIPDSVTSIGDNAFQSCTSLEEIVFSENVTSISIGDGAFYGCTSLKSVTLPKGVTSIGDYAFSDCDELTTVYYRGSKEQWDSIIGSDNDALKEAEIIYNYTGE